MLYSRPMQTDRLLDELFTRTRPLVGMVHLLPLPGSPRWGGSMHAVVERALEDAGAIADGGMDGIIVENYLDAPFYPDSVPPETTAAMATVVAEVTRAVRIPVGVNVLRNDAAAALAVSVAAGAAFIRVNVHTGAMLTDQGWIEGRAHETLRMRRRLGAPIAILADILVKHAVPPAGLELAQAARDAWHRGLADGLVVSGAETGAATDPERLRALRAAVPEAAIWIGSGLTPENAAELLPLCDGAILGTSIARDGIAGRGIDPHRVREVLAAADRIFST